jgi:hypothetical protein
VFQRDDTFGQSQFRCQYRRTMAFPGPLPQPPGLGVSFPSFLPLPARQGQGGAAPRFSHRIDLPVWMPAHPWGARAWGMPCDVLEGHCERRRRSRMARSEFAEVFCQDRRPESRPASALVGCCILRRSLPEERARPHKAVREMRVRLATRTRGTVSQRGQLVRGCPNEWTRPAHTEHFIRKGAGCGANASWHPIRSFL